MPKALFFRAALVLFPLVAFAQPAAEDEDIVDIAPPSPVKAAPVPAPSPATTVAVEATKPTPSASLVSPLGELATEGAPSKADSPAVDLKTANAPAPAPAPVHATPAPVPNPKPVAAKPSPVAPPAVKLADVPGRTPVAPVAVSRTTAASTHFLWEKTPLSVAFDELSRLRGMRLQYSGPEGVLVTGDYRTKNGPETLQGIVNQAGLTVTQAGGVFYVAAKPTPAEVAAKAVAAGKPAIEVNTLYNRSYTIPAGLQPQFSAQFSALKNPAFGMKVIPGADADKVLVRVTADREGHLRLESSMRQIAASYRAPAAAQADPKVEKARKRLLKERASLNEKLQGNASNRGW